MIQKIDQFTKEKVSVKSIQFFRMYGRAEYETSLGSFGMNKMTMPSGAKTWEEALQVVQGKVYFYYNDGYGSTRTIVEDLEI